MNESKETIIIIGAGLAGLCTALSLSRSGYYRIELIEKRHNFLHQGATFGLAPNGTKALEEMFPGIVKDCLSRTGILMESGGYMLGWWDIRDALLSRVREDNNITLRMGCQIEKIDDNPREPEAKIRFQNYDNLIVSGKLVIAADGVYSTVRRQIGLPEAKNVGTTCWRGNIDAYQSAPESKLPSLLEKGTIPMGIWHDNTFIIVFNFHPKKIGRLAWAVYTKKERGDINSTPNSLFLEMDNKENEDMIQEIFNLSNQEELKECNDLSVVDLTDECLKNVRGWGGSGRITLIGDAAHAMRPVSGQGGSMAFEDSVVLTRMLTKDGVAESLYSHEFCNELIKNFEMERFDRVRTISVDQYDRAENSYKNKMVPWTEEFEKWIYEGV